MSLGYRQCTGLVGLQSAIDAVRLYMRDYPQLNRLIEGVESTDRMIAWAIIDVLDDWNATPPHIGVYALSNLPQSYVRLGATARLLESVVILGTRNYIQFSDGGTSVSFTANLGHAMNMARMLWERYEQKKLRYKIAQNISQAWGGGVHSDYLFINSWGLYGISE